jgi:hypothetical protein
MLLCEQKSHTLAGRQLSSPLRRAQDAGEDIEIAWKTEIRWFCRRTFGIAGVVGFLTPHRVDGGFGGA